MPRKVNPSFTSDEALAGPLGTRTGDQVTLERAVAVAEGLRAAFRPLVESFAGTSPRPATLSRGLGIDATLAARLVRLVKSVDMSDVMHEIPSPQGLRIALAAAQERRVALPIYLRALSEVNRFEALLHDIPRGRNGLDVMAAEWSSATRVRVESAARQAVYRSMSSLMGFACERTLETAIIQPSEGSERSCDTIFLLGKFGIRRLRHGGRVTVYGRQDDDELAVPGTGGTTVSLQGTPISGATDCFLHDFCSSPLPEIQIARRPGLELCVLPEGVPGVNDPASIVGAQLVRRSGLRPLKTEDPPWAEGFVSRLPSKYLLFDLFVKEGTFDQEPRLTSTLYGFAPSNLSPDSDTFRLDEVSLSGKIERLDRGLGDIQCAEIPSYPAMIDQVFRRSGWDRSKFIGYRFRVRYPVPLVRLTYWFFPRKVSNLPSGTAEEVGQ